MELLKYLRREQYPTKEIIVIDNASPNENPDIIAQSYPEIKLIKSEKNLGFAGGNNRALQEATGDYICILNNDTIVPKKFFMPLIDRLQRDPTIGMISPKIRYYHHPRTIQYAGYTTMHRWKIKNRAQGYGERDYGQYDHLRTSSSAHGAAMLFHKKLLSHVGMMNESYFLYYEELDWCEEIKSAGFKIGLDTTVSAYHKASLSTGKNSPLKTYYQTRNRFLYAKRNHTPAEQRLFLLYFLFAVFPVRTFRYLKQYDTSNLIAFWRACLPQLISLLRGTGRIVSYHAVILSLSQLQIGLP